MFPQWRFLVFILSVFFVNQLSSQERCAWEHIHSSYHSTTGLHYTPPSPLSYIQEDGIEGAAVITIPVVVHVIHSGQSLGSGVNLEESLIHAQIEQINDDFRRQNSDAGKTPNMFKDVAADVEIEFCLAQRDPDGFPTTGINRYNFGVSSYTPDQFKHIVQSRTTWNRDKYLNIWITNLNGYLGYAYLPGGEPVGDGLTLDYITVGSLTQPNPTSSPFRYGRTATHEIGHWLGLDHHWATANDCFRDDGVFDTPKQYSYYIGKPSHPKSSCGSTDMFMNFLDYVDDDMMNLYTEGQKSVMRTILHTTRSSIQSSTACQTPVPLIMFKESGAAYMEGSVNCELSGSKKVTVEMVIAKAPSRTATVTLLPEGDAEINKDYSLSRSVISFRAGSTQSQFFDIIIHEDAEIEELEEIALSFQLQNGGGNAQKGPNNQKFTVQLINDDVEAKALQMNEQPVGSVMGSSSTSSPFMGQYADARFQAIYTAEEMRQAGLSPGYIETISFYITEKRSTQVYQNFALKLTLTSQSEYGDYPHFSSGAQTVYQKDLFTVAGKMELPLDIPFFWDGESNLLLETCYDNSRGSQSDKVQFYNTGLSNKVLYEWNQTYPGCLLDFMPSRHSLRPVIYLEIKEGMDIATQINITDGFAEYELGPYEEINLTDQKTGEIMMSIENLSGHDYGCTMVYIDRQGEGAIDLWGDDDALWKSFYVSPTYNNPYGEYKVTLYYTKSEVESWERQNRKGQNKSELRLTKCTHSIASSTYRDCESLDLELINFGNHYGFTTTVETGFSGFTLSNWDGGGFLPIQGFHIDAQVHDGQSDEHPSFVQLSGELIGQLDDHAEIHWYRQTRQEQPEWLGVQYPEDYFISWIDDDNMAPIERLYFAEYHHGHEVIKSNTVSVELPSHWTVFAGPDVLVMRNSHESCEIEIYSIDGKLIWSGSLQGQQEKTLNLSSFSHQLVLIQRKVKGDTDIQKVFIP